MKKLLFTALLAVCVGVIANSVTKVESTTKIVAYGDWPTINEYYCGACNKPLNSPQPMIRNGMWINGEVGCPMCKKELTWQEVPNGRTTGMRWDGSWFRMVYIQKYIWIPKFGGNTGGGSGPGGGFVGQMK